MFADWPAESAAFEPFCQDPKSASVPTQDFEPVAPPIGEHKPMARQGVLSQDLLGQPAQGVKTAAQVHRSDGHKDARGVAQCQHEARK